MKHFFRDIIDQAWTLVGLAIGWLVLEGSAKDVVGKLILITFVIWVITHPIRKDGEK